MTKQTTKVCPECGSTNLVLLRSINQKRCHCGAVMHWQLAEGQKPLIRSNRAK